MKVTICNLGIINKVQIDLKPLTVFIGENGTGKTWTAYTLAGMLGKYGFDYYIVKQFWFFMEYFLHICYIPSEF